MNVKGVFVGYQYIFAFLHWFDTSFTLHNHCYRFQGTIHLFNHYDEFRDESTSNLDISSWSKTTESLLGYFCSPYMHCTTNTYHIYCKCHLVS